MRTALFSGGFLAIALVYAQAPGPANTNGGCHISAQGGGSGAAQAFYYAPGDTDDVGINANSYGTCDAGSYAQVQLVTNTGSTLNCGYLPLDGSSHTLSCPNYPRGSAPTGDYYQFRLYVLANSYTYVDFYITHTQVTSTAAQPTSTITVTPTSTETDTETVTNTDTETTQVTVTTPASTDIMTITTSLPIATTTQTKTITFVVVVQKYSATKTTVTKTASCSYLSNAPCPTASGKPHNKRSLPMRIERDLVDRELHKRDTPNGGEGLNGDGPLTTTTTPDPASTTSTAPATTTTVETTTTAPDTTTTIPGTPPTIIVSSGTASSTTTTTLPQITQTKTRYTATIVVTTSTKVYTWTKTVTTTPPCKK